MFGFPGVACVTSHGRIKDELSCWQRLISDSKSPKPKTCSLDRCAPNPNAPRVMNLAVPVPGVVVSANGRDVHVSWNSVNEVPRTAQRRCTQSTGITGVGFASSTELRASGSCSWKSQVWRWISIRRIPIQVLTKYLRASGTSDDIGAYKSGPERNAQENFCKFCFLAHGDRTDSFGIQTRRPAQEKGILPLLDPVDGFRGSRQVLVKPIHAFQDDFLERPLAPLLVLHLGCC